MAFAKKDSERTFENSKNELKTKEEILKKELEKSQEIFKNEQMSMFVMEAELRELKSEFERVKQNLIDEGRRNVELQKLIREEKMDATMRFLLNHSTEIHRVDKIHSSLKNVNHQFKQRMSPVLPPLKSSSPSATKSSLR